MTECPDYTDEELEKEAQYERRFYQEGLARAYQQMKEAVDNGRLPDVGVG